MINKIDLIARWLLGLIFIVFGLNGFLHFIPMPEPTPESGAFFYALLKTGYFLPVLKLTEIISGVLLVLGRFVPLALTLLAPVIVQIFLFHIFLDHSGIGIAVIIIVAEIYLAYTYRDNFKSLFGKHTDK